VRKHLRLPRLLRLVLKRENGVGEGSGKEKSLAFFRKLINDVGEFGSESLGEETIRFVEDLWR